MQPNKSDHIEFTHKDLTFTIRARATRGDQYEMNATMADDSEMQGGKIIRVRPARLFPWLIERFVTGWNHPGPWSLKTLMDMPADPGEDLILILGSYILNHTGIVPGDHTEAKKKA